MCIFASVFNAFKKTAINNNYKTNAFGAVKVSGELE